MVDADSFLLESTSVFHFRVETIFKRFSGNTTNEIRCWETHIKKANEDAEKSIDDAVKRQKDKIEEYCQKARKRGEKEAKTIRSDNEKNVKELYDKALTLENEAVNKAVEEVMKF